MKELMQDVLDMREAGFSIEAIANALKCSLALVESAIEFINQIEQHYDRNKP
jgi:uncharacterized protein (DUF433 family)